jgi:predicted nucleic acid-binding protein
MTMKKQRPLRCYADTSVFGGIADAEFTTATAKFFALVRTGALELVTSPLVADEITLALVKVQIFFEEATADSEIVEVTKGAIALRRAYLRAEVVGPQWDADALHVALATVAKCAMIVSWNFKHIVNFRRIPLYNAVNEAHGYRPIAIHSPLEVIADEE